MICIPSHVQLTYVLSSLPMFMFSFFEALKGVIKKLDYYQSRFRAPELRCSHFLKKNGISIFEFQKNPKKKNLGIHIHGHNTRSKFQHKTRSDLGYRKKNLTAYRSKTTTIFVRNLSFLYLPKYNVFLVEISTLRSKCVQVCAHFFAEFSES